MGKKKVFEFTGGKRCVDCDEQIKPARVQHFPKAKRCAPCQTARDKHVAAAEVASGAGGITIIKG